MCKHEMRSSPRVTGDVVLRDYTGYWSTVVELRLSRGEGRTLIYYTHSIENCWHKIQIKQMTFVHFARYNQPTCFEVFHLRRGWTPRMTDPQAFDLTHI